LGTSAFLFACFIQTTEQFSIERGKCGSTLKDTEENKNVILVPIGYGSRFT
jgi:hypothetical protein